MGVLFSDLHPNLGGRVICDGRRVQQWSRTVRTTFLATAAAIGFAGSATVADLPVKAPVLTPPPMSWTGFYVGVNAGCAWTEHNNVDVLSTPVFQDSPLAVGSAAAVSNAAAAGGTATLDGGNRAGFIGGGLRPAIWDHHPPHCASWNGPPFRLALAKMTREFKEGHEKRRHGELKGE
jgi:hypothetical protein